MLSSLNADRDRHMGRPEAMKHHDRVEQLPVPRPADRGHSLDPAQLGHDAQPAAGIALEVTFSWPDSEQRSDCARSAA